MEYNISNQNTVSDTNIVEQIVNRKIRNSMLWMVWGLATTALISFFTYNDVTWMRMALKNFYYLLIAEFVVVFLFGRFQVTAGNTALKIMFFAYSILNGLTLSVLMILYSADVIALALVGSIAFFAAFAFIGKVTKRDLSSLRSYLIAALIGMILCSVAMILLGIKDIVLHVLSYIAVGVFAVFTAYDVNQIKRTVMELAYEDDDVLERVELYGALSLYLDFINIFINLLRIFGRR